MLMFDWKSLELLLAFPQWLVGVIDDDPFDWVLMVPMMRPILNVDGDLKLSMCLVWLLVLMLLQLFELGDVVVVVVVYDDDGQMMSQAVDVSMMWMKLLLLLLLLIVMVVVVVVVIVMNFERIVIESP